MADGRWVEKEHESGVVSRVLVEPSEEYLAKRRAEAEAEETHERQQAQQVVDEIDALERATLGQLRAYVIAQAKERLGYDRAVEVLGRREGNASQE